MHCYRPNHTKLQASHCNVRAADLCKRGLLVCHVHTPVRDMQGLPAANHELNSDERPPNVRVQRPNAKSAPLTSHPELRVAVQLNSGEVPSAQQLLAGIQQSTVQISSSNNSNNSSPTNETQAGSPKATAAASHSNSSTQDASNWATAASLLPRRTNIRQWAGLIRQIAHATAQAVRTIESMQYHAPALITKSVDLLAARAQEDIQLVQAALQSLQADRQQVRDLKAQVEALQEHTDSLHAALEDAQKRAQFAESQVATLQSRLEAGRALQAVDIAVQTFRRHVSGLPAGFNPATNFYEHPEDIIGRGGCAVVYAWSGPSSTHKSNGQSLSTASSSAEALTPSTAEWAVKVDSVSYRYANSNDFQPERCADLLPALLPPHANILAPKAWWVGTMQQQQQVKQPALAVAANSDTSVSTLTTAALAPSAKPASGFKLYTLYQRYTCSLWELMQQLHTQHLSGPATNKTLLLDLRSILVVVRDVAAALEHLASHRALHCDIKAENVLLSLQPTNSTDSNAAPRVASAVVIDFGLARLMPPGIDQLPARGGTWLYKAPEQLTGPPGLVLAGQERSSSPYVCQSTDVWALGMLMCMLCNNGQLPSHTGLPFAYTKQQVLKWGDRPNGNGSVEPFYMLWDDVLPTQQACCEPDCPVPAQSPSSAASSTQGKKQSYGAQQQAHVVGLLRRLAIGCLHPDPAQRLSPSQVKAAANEALVYLE